jgi:hypothetical protein
VPPPARATGSSRRGVCHGARPGTGQQDGRPCGPRSRTPASSPPRLSWTRGATSISATL